MADHSNLPAPYESPWRQLGHAARAVLASLGLDLRSLWRRNRTGELPRVRWWPRDLAPLFWPLVLAAGLGLVLLSAGWLTGLRRQPQHTSAPLTTAAEVNDANNESAAGDTRVLSAENGGQNANPNATESSTKSSTEITTESTREITTGDAPLAPSGTAPSDPTSGSDASASSDEALRERISADDRERWIVAADAAPDRQLVVLKLGDGFNRLDPQARRRQAERWLERVRELGFEQLELRSRDGELLGYRARVGSGMILLEPTAST